MWYAKYFLVDLIQTGQQNPGQILIQSRSSKPTLHQISNTIRKEGYEYSELFYNKLSDGEAILLKSNLEVIEHKEEYDMFKGEKGICERCAENAKNLGVEPVEKWIVIKKPYLCKFHNEERKSKKRKTKINPTTIKSIKKATGEGEMFKSIWANRKSNKCTGCDADLGNEPRAHYFSHILKKGSYPALRLDPKNIMLECQFCHNTWDYGTLEEKKKMNNFKAKLRYIKKHAPNLYFKLTAK